jgi:hypothetical protein
VTKASTAAVAGGAYHFHARLMIETKTVNSTEFRPPVQFDIISAAGIVEEDFCISAGSVWRLTPTRTW